ncbi:LamG domain-containing protein [Streptomyces sp. NPDC091215]|uniref:LamG domain-containing protein n=1 Tax=Streptomyces sp. NPDC091215 TaxID=3155192 RepID=UPI003439E08B
MTGPIAATRMGRRLTAPFERGADTLSLGLTLLTSSQATVDDYDFTDHFARFGVLPQPRYVLTVARDFDVETVVKLDYDEPGSDTASVAVTVPAGTVAGTTFLFDNPTTATARARMLTMQPEPDDNNPPTWLALTALLGNTAKLLWVVGAERDQLRGHAARTVAQRHVASAVGLSLDIIGHDLGVPRFPPLSHSFDTDTVALYHLDDTKSPAVDVAAKFPGRTGSSGALSADVQVGVPGRYGTATAFRASSAVITAPTSTAFDIDGDATVECFVRPDPNTKEGPVISKNPDPDDGSPGWVLRIGDAGSEVRFIISDGTTVIDVCAEVTLPTDRFTHIAAVVDRSVDRGVSIYVDGVFQAFQFLFPLHTVANTANLLIGAAGGGFRGVVDEVRISSVARRDFAPVLGESDEHYRSRLELFRRWTLPTPANLAAVLNELVGQIGPPPDPGDTQPPPLVVDDTNATLVRGTRLVHIRPKTLLPGETIDALGRKDIDEASVVGTAAQEELFDPAYLFRYDRSDVDFTPATAGRADPHLMQIGVADRLTELVALAAAKTSLPGRLLVDSAFDPTAPDLRATGRAVLLGHSSVSLDVLGALAHRAGFDFVEYRADAARIYAVTAIGDYFTIDTGPGSDGPTDLDVGHGVALSLRPKPPSDAFVHWLLVPTDGAGAATLVPDGKPGSPQHMADLAATAAGRLIVKADVTRNGRTVSPTRVLRIGVTGLPDGQTIAADGTITDVGSIVETKSDFFDAAFLFRHDDTNVDYASPAAQSMQPAVAELLDALAAELTRRAVTGRLTVSSAFDTDGDQAAKEGRELVLRHSGLTPDALAGVAFAVGFSHVDHKADAVVVRQAPGQLVRVRGPEDTEQGGVIELDEDQAVVLTATPAPPLPGLTGQVPGEGPRLGWASGTFDNAAITVDSSTQPTITLHAVGAGTAWIQAGYLVGGQQNPYTFQVRLRPELDIPATVITKDQFDLIMNVLNVLHPIGVEVNTAAIRAHVIEVGDSTQINPDFTYPKFRVRGPLPPQVRRPPNG